MKDKETGDAKGYAFIAFKTKEVAQKAIEEIHNKDFKVIMVLILESAILSLDHCCLAVLFDIFYYCRVKT